MWFTASSVTATNNSNVVKINSNENIANVKPGDALIIGSFNPVEILKAYASDQGSFIQLTQAWTNATQSQVPALVLPTRSALNEAITAINGANKLVNDNYQAILDWQTKTGEVTFKDLDNVSFTVKTMKELQSDIEFSNPYPHAMTEVQYEALRAERKAKYKNSCFIEPGNHYIGSNNYDVVSDGMWTAYADKVNSGIRLGRASKDGTISNSKSPFPIVIIDGVLFSLEAGYHSDSCGVNIPMLPAPDGSKTFDLLDGSLVEHNSPEIAFASETNTSKVIKNRKDLILLIKRSHIISDTNYVYPLSHKQYRRGSYLGLAVQNTEHGTIHTWSELTQEQRDLYTAEPKNCIRRLSNGKLKQDYFEFVVVEGMGSDWYGKASLGGGSGPTPWDCRYLGFGVKSGSAWLYFDSNTNKLTKNISSSNLLESDSNYSANPNTQGDIGLFKNEDGSVCAMPIAMYEHLNKGVFHYQHNILGTASPTMPNLNGETTSSNSISALMNMDEYESAVECFRLGSGFGENPVKSGIYANTGSIESTSSYNGLRPYKAKFHDAVYREHIFDLRLIHKATLDLGTEVRKALNAKLQGKEKIPFTTIGKYIVSAANSYGGGRYLRFENIDDPRTIIFDKSQAVIYNASKDEIYYAATIEATAIYISSNEIVQHLPNTYTGGGREINPVSSAEVGDTIYIFNTYYKDDFELSKQPCIDLLGAPDELMKKWNTGIYGSWNKSILDSLGAKNIHFTKPPKPLPLGSARLYSNSEDINQFKDYSIAVNYLGSWVSHATNVTGSVGLVFYESEAASTEFSARGQVVGMEAKFISCMDSRSEYGGLLAYSLCKLTHSNNPSSTTPSVQLSSVNSLPITDDGIYWGENKSIGLMLHDDLFIGKPSHSSVGFKSSISFVEERGLLYLQFNGSQIVHSGTNWGDDKIIPIVSGHNTKTDLNQNTVKVFCHRSTFPVGIA